MCSILRSVPGHHDSGRKIVQRISISTDGKLVFTHDQDAPRIAVIDAATNKVASWIELPDVAYGSAPTPDGRWLLSVSMSADHLFVIDLQTMKVVRTLDVAKGSSEVLVRPDGGVAYVSGTGGGKIAVADLRCLENGGSHRADSGR